MSGAKVGKGDEHEEILCVFSSFFLISLNYILQILLLSENVFILNYLEVFFFFAFVTVRSI